MTKKCICCFTGHRHIPVDQLTMVREKLKEEVLMAISHGYTHFISGFAAGADLLFAEIVVDLKRKHPITLEAAIPYPKRMKTTNKAFQSLIGYCDVVKIHSDHYCRECYRKRNRYMVDQSSLVIAVYDGRLEGGTAATLRYAYSTNRFVREISFHRELD